MAIRVAVEGFKGRTIEVQPPGLLGIGRASLSVDGKVVPRDANRQMHLRRNDGKQVIAAWKDHALGLGMPQLVVDGTVIDVVEPLKWYAWVWNALPLSLVLIGGFIGTVAGLIAFGVNTRIFWSRRATTSKFVLSAIVSVIAFLIYIVMSTLLFRGTGR